jgi:hypothetical protein
VLRSSEDDLIGCKVGGRLGIMEWGGRRRTSGIGMTAIRWVEGFVYAMLCVLLIDRGLKGVRCA